MAPREQSNAARLAYLKNSGNTGIDEPAVPKKSAVRKVIIKNIKRTVMLWMLGVFLALLPWILLFGVIMIAVLVIMEIIPGS